MAEREELVDSIASFGLFSVLIGTSGKPTLRTSRM